MSGEAISWFNSEEVEGNPVKLLKRQLAKQIGIPRFQQRWFHENKELDDDSFLAVLASPSPCVQLVILDFVLPEEGQDEKFLSACAKNRCGEVETLLQLPLSPDVTDEEGWSPLLTAAWAGHWQCISLLQEARANTDQEDAFGFTALHFAAQKGHLKVSRLLLQAGTDKDRVADDGATPLHWAAANGHLEVLQLLIEAGVDKDKVSEEDGFTALHIAVQDGDVEVVRLLLQAGADKDQVHRSGQTAWHFAAQTGDQEVMKLLSADNTEKALGHGGFFQIVRLSVSGFP